MFYVTRVLFLVKKKKKRRNWDREGKRAWNRVFVAGNCPTRSWVREVYAWSMARLVAGPSGSYRGGQIWPGCVAFDPGALGQWRNRWIGGSRGWLTIGRQAGRIVRSWRWLCEHGGSQPLLSEGKLRRSEARKSTRRQLLPTLRNRGDSAVGTGGSRGGLCAREEAPSARLLVVVVVHPPWLVWRLSVTG